MLLYIADVAAAVTGHVPLQLWDTEPAAHCAPRLCEIDLNVVMRHRAVLRVEVTYLTAPFLPRGIRCHGHHS